MLRELFDNEAWNLLKQHNEELCERAGSLPEEIPLYNIRPMPQSDSEREYINRQNGL